MPMLRDQDRALITERLAKSLEAPVTIRLFGQSMVRSLLTIPGQQPAQGPDVPKLVHDLLQELVATSPKLKLEVIDVYGAGAAEAKRLGVEHIPTILIGDDAQGRVRFTGAPVGNEFGTIIEAVEGVSANKPHLRDDIAEAARTRLTDAVNLKVFVTPT